MRKRRNVLSPLFVFIAIVLFLVYGVQPSLGGTKWGEVDWDDPFDLPEEILHKIYYNNAIRIYHSLAFS